MNIGIFSDTYYPQVNGVVSSINILKKELERRGHKVYVFTTSNPLVKKASLNIFRLPSMPFMFLPTYRIAIFYSPKLLAKIKKFNLDIIHTQTEFSVGIFGKIVSKAFKIPMIHTYHTMYEDYVHYIAKGHLVSPKMAQKFSKIFCNRAKLVIAPSQKTKDRLIDYGVNKPIKIIPTGVDLEKFYSKINPDEIKKIKQDLNINQNDFVILFLGRLAKEKSIDILISQMPNILKKISNAKLLIVGGGPYIKILENLARELNITKNIIFTGEIPWKDINLYYKLGNVFISASTSETQGLTYIEAMASDVPVIAKNDGCIKDLIINNKNGFIFDDPNDLANIIYKLKDNLDLKNKIINNAHETINNLSAKKFGERVEEAYLSLINSNINL